MNQTEELNEIDIHALAPELRATGQPSGVPMEIDGQTWHLAHGGVASILDEYRNRMDDHARIRAKVDMMDVFECGRIMLLANYELREDEIIRLLVSADRDGLANAVMKALFGDEEGHRTYSEWMMSSLLANGLDPEKIPAEWVPLVLEQLVMLKRCVPIGEYTDAAIAAPKLAAARGRAEAFKARQAGLQVQQAAMAPPAPVEQPPGESP